jgi:hypothetical protein
MTSLLVAIYISVSMKFPKDGDKDNELAEIINKVPFFKNLTISEIVTTLAL